MIQFVTETNLGGVMTLVLPESKTLRGRADNEDNVRDG